MKRKIEYFGYLVPDYKAGQQRLNDMSKKGWAFERLLPGGIALYSADREGKYEYFVDVTDPLNDDEGYLELCADAGWTHICDRGYMRIFRAEAGAEPIHTDPELEYERIKKKVVRRMVIAAIASLPMLFMYVYYLWGAQTSFETSLVNFVASSNILTLIIFCLPFYVLGTVSYGAYLFLRLSQQRRAVKNGEEFPTPNIHMARAVGSFVILGWPAAVVAVVAIFFDMVGLSPWMFIGSLIGITVGLALGIGMHPNMSKAGARSNIRGIIITWAIAGPAIICFYVFPGLGNALPPKAPEIPIMQSEPWINTETGSFLMRRDRWSEGLTGDGTWAAHLDTVDKVYIERYVSRFSWTTDLAAHALREEWCPNAVGGVVPGTLEQDGMWRAERDNGRIILLFREGNTVAAAAFWPEAPMSEAEITEAISAFL